MLRWMILLLALSAWLASLAVVYREYGPTPPSAEALANRQARDAIFADLAPRSRRWTIYLNPKKLAGPHGSSMAFLNPRLADNWLREHQEEQRLAEDAGAFPGEVKVGRKEESVKHPDYNRAEIKTVMQLMLPVGLSPNLNELVGDPRWECTQRHTREGGLQDVTALLRLGNLEIASRVVREGDALKASVGIFRGNEKLLYTQETFALGGGSPQVDPSPFGFRPEIKLGDEWEIGMLDLTQSSGRPVLAAVRAKVLRQTATKFHGRYVGVYEVEAKHEQLQYYAYYSPEGYVLKEHWKFKELLDLTFVRDEADFSDGAHAEAPRAEP